ncbi:Wzz/FepE/Etk N-terminal domain-containing protein [Aquiflexum gelatinilyticum]|uniref:Wzz/FepE/Etk N-terminal domain-containing protein n=1 Tax=Aquiflexum gelatinilyticum TaxID=2961943 RepID=A0A9X2P3W6_9BACT|nr:Wzz/FepE/Etk N-terminal domain-containing protein [Aquiflexum gelatinilyticum]MCR9015461.1 Wzz/FepE/Etk N-terminal domain-containing protein [Aquiflexum gelatinilyticum]
MEEPKLNSTIQSDEIDLLELAKTAWTSRKIIFSITMIFTVLGLIVSLVLKNEYTAGSTFVPQTSEPNKVGGSLGGLASLAGINLSGMGGGNEIPPTLYPKIVTSVPFRKSLIEAKIQPYGSDKPITYRYYFDSVYRPSILTVMGKYSIGLPGLLIKALKGTNNQNIELNKFGLINISENEFEHFKRLENQVAIQFNEKEGFVSLSFSMPEPRIAAQMAKFAEELLQKEVIEFKIQNAREQLKFTEERFQEKKTEFELIENRLANFRDRNQNLSSAIVINQLQKLEAEYNFAFNVYNELAKQLEQAKLQVSKDTPIFSIIQPVTVPIEKSAPKRPLILVGFAFVGFLFSIGYVFGNQYFSTIKEMWNR